jgi:hypothetical protein
MNMKSQVLRSQGNNDNLKPFQSLLRRPRSSDSGSGTTVVSLDPEVGLGEFEPTETEEFSDTEFDDSQHVIVATQGKEEHSNKEQQPQPQRQQRAQHQIPILPPFRGSRRKKEEKSAIITAANASPVEAVGTQNSTSSTPLLLSVQELTDLLHEANQDATVYRNKRRNRRVPALIDVNANYGKMHANVEDDTKKTSSNSQPRPHLLKLDDMTSVLKHINMAEEAKRPIRWDLIGEMTAVVYGGARNHHQPSKYAAANDTDDDGTASVESTSREILTMMLEHDESVCHSDCGTASLDGYPLNPSAYTCASSVTWFDSSLYEEIEVSDDECDFYEEIVLDEDDNDHSCVSLVFEGECASFISGSSRI